MVVSKFINFNNERYVWFKNLDNEMSGVFCGIQPKLRNSILNRESKIIGQEILPWNDEISQFESDLRNDVTEVNKLFIKVAYKKIKNNLPDNVKERIFTDVLKLHDRLSMYYEKTFKEKNINYIYDYYQMRRFLQGICKNINDILEN
ncbi:MAG: hypothetical protein K2F57_02150 [Candidatus Gastranaerophilales bacterium]|nr:hypothetical protein [Candidatus Gastranaerophilales bacterium]